MKELGGYFELETFSGNEIYKGLTAVNNARNALVYIMRAKKIKKLYIPYFLCDSVSKVCDREGYSYEFYNINNNFLPMFDKKLEDDKYLYIVNFYGQISNKKVKELKKQFGNIIFDNVQAFFQKPVKGIDTIYSCRKFFGVPDGGYVSTDVKLDENLCRDVSMNRMKHILGRFEGACASAYYADFKANDQMFSTTELCEMSKLTKNIMRAIDYKAVKRKRQENFSILHKSLGDLNKLRLHMPVGPYAYPFYCENGIEVRKKLAEKKIYVATLWPNVLDTQTFVEKDYAENILPLPCDQRYDICDMNYIVEELGKCMKN